VILTGYFSFLELVKSRKEPLSIFLIQPVLPKRAITLQRFRLNTNEVESVWRDDSNREVRGSLVDNARKGGQEVAHLVISATKG